MRIESNEIFVRLAEHLIDKKNVIELRKILTNFPAEKWTVRDADNFYSQDRFGEYVFELADLYCDEGSFVSAVESLEELNTENLQFNGAHGDTLVYRILQNNQFSLAIRLLNVLATNRVPNFSMHVRQCYLAAFDQQDVECQQQILTTFKVSLECSEMDVDYYRTNGQHEKADALQKEIDANQESLLDTREQEPLW